MIFLSCYYSRGWNRIYNARSLRCSIHSFLHRLPREKFKRSVSTNRIQLIRTRYSNSYLSFINLPQSSFLFPFNRIILKYIAIVVSSKCKLRFQHRVEPPTFFESRVGCPTYPPLCPISWRRKERKEEEERRKWSVMDIEENRGEENHEEK